MKNRTMTLHKDKTGALCVRRLAPIVMVLLLVAVLSGCANGDNKEVDQEALKTIAGEYQAVEKNVDKSAAEGYVGNWWHLSIQEKNADTKKPHLSIYDDSAGNPGVEGNIIYLDGEKVIVEIDPDYYEELPSAMWKCDDKTLEVSYEIRKNDIVLTNNKEEISFRKD